VKANPIGEAKGGKQTYAATIGPIFSGTDYTIVVDRVKPGPPLSKALKEGLPSAIAAVEKTILETAANLKKAIEDGNGKKSKRLKRTLEEQVSPKGFARLLGSELGKNRITPPDGPLLTPRGAAKSFQVALETLYEKDIGAPYLEKRIQRAAAIRFHAHQALAHLAKIENAEPAEQCGSFKQDADQKTAPRLSETPNWKVLQNRLKTVHSDFLPGAAVDLSSRYHAALTAVGIESAKGMSAKEAHEHHGCRELAVLEDLLQKVEASAGTMKPHTKDPKIVAFRDGVTQSKAQATYVTLDRVLETDKDQLKTFVTLDVGGALVIYGEAGADFATLVGLSINFVPFDRTEPHCWSKCSPYDIARRFSLFTGLSLTNPTRGGDLKLKGVIGDRMAFVGAGVHLTRFLELSGGAMVMRQQSSNPLAGDPKTTAAGFIGLTLDYDVGGTILEGLGAPFKK
jgi:hypothetical protein